MKNIFNSFSLLFVAIIAMVATAFTWYTGEAVDPSMLAVAAAGNVYLSTDEQRAVYGRLQNWFPANGMGQAQNFIITESTLQVEQLLTNNQNSYNFDLYDGSQSADTPTEIKLNRNDLFFATHIALGIKKYNPTKTPVWFGNYPIFTYPDSNYFVGTGSSAAIEYQALEALYSGQLVFNTGAVNRFGPLATTLLKYTPNRPFELGVSASSATTMVFPEYGPTLAGRGFHRVTPNLVIDGQQTNRFQLALGAGDYTNIAGATVAAGTAAETRNLVVLQVHGFRAVDAAAAAKQAGTTPITF